MVAEGDDSDRLSSSLRQLAADVDIYLLEERCTFDPAVDFATIIRASLLPE